MSSYPPTLLLNGLGKCTGPLRSPDVVTAWEEVIVHGGGNEHRVDRGHVEPDHRLRPVSVGCDNCYALTLARRLKAIGAEKCQNDGDPRTSGPGFGVTVHPNVLLAPYSWRQPRIVFVNSMSDLFHAKVPLDFVRQVLQVIADTPQHTYQVLTKRSVRLRKVADQLDWRTTCGLA